MLVGLAAFPFVGLGVGLAVVGAVCVVAVPLVGWTWFSRVASVVVMALIPLIVGVPSSANHGSLPWLDPATTLSLGVLVVLWLSFVMKLWMRELYRVASPLHRRLLAVGIWWLPLGTAVALIPSILTLLGVHTS